MERRVRAYVGLGSNVGDAMATLARAVGALDRLPGARVRAVSRLYSTTPVGVRDQPDFLNAVVALDVPGGADPDAAALELLGHLKTIERDLGRQPRRRWGPREVDLDLLVFGRHEVKLERPPELVGETALAAAARRGGPPAPKLLEVPHRDVAERLFVLAPLSELVPRLVPPGWRETVTAARRRRETIEGLDAARPVAEWNPEQGRWVAGLASGGRPRATGAADDRERRRGRER
jgi:2-amino-4-hydroxy-6-hydroxymethyldihydropteridine diphosphokinase